MNPTNLRHFRPLSHQYGKIIFKEGGNKNTDVYMHYFSFLCYLYTGEYAHWKHLGPELLEKTVPGMLFLNSSNHSTLRRTVSDNVSHKS